MNTLAETFEQVLIAGNLNALTSDQRVMYYNKVCESLGLNPLTRPFEYLSLNGKLVLYATRAATEQLRKLNKIALSITSRETIEGVYVVTARATDAAGRTDESTGAVSISTLKGEALANALMKAETKAKRRVTLSICGLGLLDESEADSIPGAQRVNDVALDYRKQETRAVEAPKPEFENLRTASTLEPVTIYEADKNPFLYKIEAQIKGFEGKPLLHLSDEQLQKAARTRKKLTQRDLANIDAAVQIIANGGRADVDDSEEEDIDQSVPMYSPEEA